MQVDRKRILGIGSGGAGKSTFARELAVRTGLPLVHLDLVHWSSGWVPMAKEQWLACVEDLSARERWILDGNYTGSLAIRIRRCDAIVFFDMPRWICVAGVVQRWWANRRKARPDLPAGCDERLNWEFIRWVWSYPKEVRPRIFEALAEAGPEVEVITIRSRAEARSVLSQIRPWEVDEVTMCVFHSTKSFKFCLRSSETTVSRSSETPVYAPGYDVPLGYGGY